MSRGTSVPLGALPGRTCLWTLPLSLRPPSKELSGQHASVPSTHPVCWKGTLWPRSERPRDGQQCIQCRCISVRLHCGILHMSHQNSVLCRQTPRHPESAIKESALCPVSTIHTLLKDTSHRTSHYKMDRSFLPCPQFVSADAHYWCLLHPHMQLEGN